MTDPSTLSTLRIHQIISLIDLTNLNNDCDQAAIDSLCTQSSTPVGPVAAICIWPEFVSTARELLGTHSPVQIATVVNFPSGDDALPVICSTIETALKDGATEIDYVLPYSALVAGNSGEVARALQRVRKATPDKIKLKVILETGELGTHDLIHEAGKIAIDGGADFIKTSTGKVPVNATVEAASIMLDLIKLTGATVGFKAAGGIKTVRDADIYLKLSEERLGKDWADSAHFRLGASSLLSDALNKLGSGKSTNDTQPDHHNY